MDALGAGCAEKKPKSAKRKKSEQIWAGVGGYPLKHDNGKRWVFGGGPVNKDIFDIDACQARRNERARQFGADRGNFF